MNSKIPQQIPLARQSMGGIAIVVMIVPNLEIKKII